MIGNRYKKLLVMSDATAKGGRAYYNCICDCGKETVVMGKNLRTGNSQSCGCGRKTFIIKPTPKDTLNYKHITTKCGKLIKVDENMYEYLNQFKWRLHKNYAIRSSIKLLGEKRGNILLHHEIIERPFNKWVDHINGDTFNNTLENLRLCTPQENVRNKRVSKSKKSKIPYKGVYYYCRDSTRFIAQINGTHLGIFRSMGDAAKAYNIAAQQLHGEFARLNNV